MKKYLILGFLIIMSFTIFSQDFRWSNIGDSLEEVKKIELEKGSEFVFQKDNQLAFKAKLIGYDVMVLHIFLNKELNACAIKFINEHSNENLFVDDYIKVHRILKSKYGEKTYKEKWSNDLFKNDPDNYGMAIGSGHLVFENTWELGNITIIHTLRGDNFKHDHNIMYASNDYLNFIKSDESKADGF